MKREKELDRTGTQLENAFFQEDPHKYCAKAAALYEDWWK